MSALIVRWWREDHAADEGERNRALRGEVRDISPQSREPGAFAGFDGLVSLLRRRMHDSED
jgi:hypothetical protein